MMNRAAWVMIGLLLAFAAGLGVIVGTQLAAPAAQMIGLGVAVGVVAGVLAGTFSALLILRSRNSQAGGEAGLTLTRQQAEALYALLDNRGKQPLSSYPTPPRSPREYQAVGGATLQDNQDE